MERDDWCQQSHLMQVKEMVGFGCGVKKSDSRLSHWLSLSHWISWSGATNAKKHGLHISHVLIACAL